MSLNRLIDFAFCRSAHGFASNEEALAWFEQPVLPDYRTFSPRFEPLQYLLNNEDLRKASVNPIAHYLRHGNSEGRKAEPIKNLREFAGADRATRAAPPADAKVAIVLHIFYPAFISYFLERLQRLDLPDWHVFISAPAELVEQYGGALRHSLGPHLASLKAVPNQGRNFAPLFVHFAEELDQYDVICHCHSKKSLYSGRRQTEWADYLISALMGSPDVVRRHVNLLLSESCDLIAPTPFVGLPPWASHTLSNDARFTQFCAKLGIDATTGFLAYPVGGMFWMSRSIYAQVRALSLKLDDFPPEPSRPDGETHHALERLLGRIARNRLAFYDQVAGRYCAAGAVLRDEVKRLSTIENLCEVINQHDVISFDFFDTLCVRSTADEEWAKRRVEFILGQDYTARRNAAEAELRAGLQAEQDVPLSAIAQKLADDGFVDPLRAVALERASDLATLRPRDEVVRAYEHAIEQDKEVIIASDSYYDKGMILEFLRRHGISQPKLILISADVGLRKDRGDMWARLVMLRGARKAVHVGDNVHSDVQRAAEHGFETFYVAHWRQELLPLAGFSTALIERSRTNPGFARNLDRVPVKASRNELSKSRLDNNTRRVRKRRSTATD